MNRLFSIMFCVKQGIFLQSCGTSTTLILAVTTPAWMVGTNSPVSFLHLPEGSERVEDADEEVNI
jgi:hypothetical protein